MRLNSSMPGTPSSPHDCSTSLTMRVSGGSKSESSRLTGFNIRSSDPFWIHRQRLYWGAIQLDGHRRRNHTCPVLDPDFAYTGTHCDGDITLRSLFRGAHSDRDAFRDGRVQSWPGANDVSGGWCDDGRARRRSAHRRVQAHHGGDVETLVAELVAGRNRRRRWRTLQHADAIAA